MIIHLIAPKDKSKWNKVWYHCYKSWENCPYPIKMWHDEDVDQLLKEDDEEFFTILNTLHPIYKWDYVRFIILEKFGGAYFDMDVEIVDSSFFNKLNSAKIYVMEGTNGSLIENSIMISREDRKDSVMWSRLKEYSKFQVLNNLEDCKEKYKVVNYVGPNLISRYFVKYLSNFKTKYEILSYPQFSSLTNEISFSRHYNISSWM
jgi:mannosyltransferase OCH1-like enzyme